MDDVVSMGSCTRRRDDATVQIGIWGRLVLSKGVEDFFTREGERMKIVGDVWVFGGNFGGIEVVVASQGGNGGSGDTLGVHGDGSLFSIRLLIRPLLCVVRGVSRWR